MSAPEKAEVVTKVSSSPLPKRKVLRELGIPKPESTDAERPWGWNKG